MHLKPLCCNIGINKLNIGLNKKENILILLFKSPFSHGAQGGIWDFVFFADIAYKFSSDTHKFNFEDENFRSKLFCLQFLDRENLQQKILDIQGR